MAGLNEIRARLADAKSDVEESLDRRRRARSEPQPAERRQGSQNGAELEAERKRRSELERELAEAWAELARSRGELAGTRSRLEQELKRAEEELKEARATATPRSRRGSSNDEGRISELEGRLVAERERREDLELALDLLQKQHAADTRRLEELERSALASASRPPPAPGVLPAAQAKPGRRRPDEAKPEQRPPEPEEDPAEGWGVSLDAFPIVEDELENGQQKRGSAASDGTGPRSVFRRRARRPDRG